MTDSDKSAQANPDCRRSELTFLRPFVPGLCQIFLASLLLSLCLLMLGAFEARADDDFLPRAIPLAQLSQRETGVPSSVTLAQATWETGRGASTVGNANNYFGIKASGASDDTVSIGPVASGWVWAWTKEWDGARYISRRERFRAYRSMEDSFRDHGLLLATTPRYADAMRAVDDAREFARRMAAAGYATSPTYARDLIALMDAENLYQYDLPRNDLELLGQSEPVAVNPGEIFQIYFDVKNTGFGTWSPAAGYYLASANENRFEAKPRQDLTHLVPPDHVQRWVITMIAPPNAGTYSTRWQMKHGERDFGAGLTLAVSVRAPVSPSWVSLAGGGLLIILGGAGIIWAVWAYKQNPRLRRRKAGIRMR